MMNDEEPILVTRPQTLDEMSIEELEARISDLKSAISACEAAIERKKAQKSAADALFGGN